LKYHMAGNIMSAAPRVGFVSLSLFLLVSNGLICVAVAAFSEAAFLIRCPVPLTAPAVSALPDDDVEDVLRGAESDAGDFPAAALPPGRAAGHSVVRTYGPVPAGGLAAVDAAAFAGRPRPHLTSSGNGTVPLALMCFDPAAYPSASRARKACRQGSVLLQRAGPDGSARPFDGPAAITARAINRIFPGDALALQARTGGGFYPYLDYDAAPFGVPVVYEDDHLAVVDKPAGVVTYSHKNGGHGRMSMKAALPYALRPPTAGTSAILRRPQPVHRLDRPTSGLLLVAKTRPAVTALTEQFVDRRIKKTYVAILNGVPFEDAGASISAREAAETLGVDVDPDDRGGRWHVIDAPLEGQSALTVWRSVAHAQSLVAADGMLTMVEVTVFFPCTCTCYYHHPDQHLCLSAASSTEGEATDGTTPPDTETHGVGRRDSARR